MRLEYQDRIGPYCGWLHVDPEALAGRAVAAGWQTEVILQDAAGNYLARLTRGRSV
jgi:hypothetical protein